MQTRFALAYAAKLTEQDDGSVLVTFRDLPDALTDGDNRADALTEASDCLECAIAARVSHAEEIPIPSRAKRGEVLIAVPLPTAGKAALAHAMRVNGVNKSELARRLGCDVKDARRLTDPRHRSHSDRLAQAIEAAGGKVAVTVSTVAAE